MPICDDCALRLYNTKSYNLQGIGNPFSGNCIIIPNVDYKAYKYKSISFSAQIEIIKEVLIPLTGEVEQNLFIVPLIRCNEQISCEVDDATYQKCLSWFAKDIKEYQFRNILLLGNSVKRFLNCNITEYLDCVMISSNNRKYFVNYSPFVKYNDDKLFETFKTKLIKWYNAINSDVYNYKFIKL